VRYLSPNETENTPKQPMTIDRYSFPCQFWIYLYLNADGQLNEQFQGRLDWHAIFNQREDAAICKAIPAMSISTASNAAAHNRRNPTG